MEVGDGTENLKYWDQDEWSGLIVVLEQFWGQRQKREDNLVGQVLKGHSMINFLDNSWNNCFEGFNGAEQLIEVAAILEVIGNLGNYFRPVVRVLIFCENTDDFPEGGSNRLFLAILNER